MREGQATVVRRADYAPPPYLIRRVELTFDLDPAKTIVASRLAIERGAGTPPGEPLVLHGEELKPMRVLCDGESISFRHEGARLVIDPPPAADAFMLEVRNAVCPERNLELSGLFASGSGLYTQCEAEGFRRIAYFIDRPDVMAVYTVTLRADRRRFPVLLSNGNLVAQRTLEDGRHEATWHDPHPKPSYLFALVAADLVCREQRIRARSGREHLLQIYVRPGDLGKTEHAMRSLMAAVAWDEARFGLSLDLERFMIVAVDDFNAGAMENKGLNLFNSRYVLASQATATDDDYMAIEGVVGHEYFHNWTGNRITCRDWFQLSLKEGLTVFRDQEFSMDMAAGCGADGAPDSARAVRRIAAVRSLRSQQFPEDASPMAHPVRPDSYTAIDNFYTATVYEKGAEVVRMMHTLVGGDGFARGVSKYVERHDGQAVTCDDFAQAIADANPDSALATRLDAFKRWYAQAGTPRLIARGQYDAAAQRYTLTLAQRALPSPGQPVKEPFVIPVRTALLAADGTVAAPERLLVLDREQQQWTFDDLPAAPIPSLLRGFSAPVQLDDGLDDEALLVLLAHDGDPFNRWEAGQRLAMRQLLRATAAEAPAAVAPAAAFIDAMRTVLRHPGLDPAFKDLVLTLPDEGYIAEQLPRFDPQRIHAARETLRLVLADALHADWSAAWESCSVTGGYEPTASQAGRRALANRALAMLCLHATHSGNPVWPGKALQRFKDATNMTDRLGAVSALLASHSPLAEAALDRLYATFRDDPLVLDKWFALQAAQPEPLGDRAGCVFERARALARHPDFTLKNPNRARSVLFTLCARNPAAFHRADGAAYEFWADRLLDLDALNPQIASRLARSLDRWSALVEPYRSAARAAIARVASNPELSDDLREVVTRTVEAE